jgi:hypothetical protein
MNKDPRKTLSSFLNKDPPSYLRQLDVAMLVTSSSLLGSLTRMPKVDLFYSQNMYENEKHKRELSQSDTLIDG